MRPWFRLAATCLSFCTLYLIFCSFRLTRSPVTRTQGPSTQDYSALPSRAPFQCTYSTCFDASQCAREHPGRPLNRIGVYVYPTPLGSLTDQFISLLSAVRNSRYAVLEPTEACVFLPQLDVLNGAQPGLDRTLRLVNKASLWNDGVNHILFNILPGKALLFSGQSILAGGGHTASTYRPTFDVAIPAYNPLLRRDLHSKAHQQSRPVLLTILPTRPGHFGSLLIEQVLSVYRDRTVHGEKQTVVLLRNAEPGNKSSSSSSGADEMPMFWASVSHNPYQTASQVLIDYADALSQSTFCALVRADRLGYLGLFDAMALGCIPVLIDDRMVLPFSEVLDWSRIAIRIRPSELKQMLTYLSAYSLADVRQFQQQVHFVFDRYMSGMERIALTTLDIINDRVFPYYARSYRQWNDPDHVENLLPSSPILFYPPRVPPQSRFTVLIRGHDHFALLCTLLERLQSVRGVDRIVVVWTNTNATIPAAALWPSLRVPLSVVPSMRGTIHGRYYPYAQLRTEAILSLDDHACPPSALEIELAFEIWSHNPSRLIGLASRREWYTNTSLLASSSSYRPQLVSASFGATFFHKHYLHAYTELLSPTVQHIVNQANLCEDLLLNWLIVQLSGLPVLTTANAANSRSVRQNLPVPTVRDMCHLEPYGECWTSLQSSHLSISPEAFKSTVPFQLAPLSVDLA